MKTQNMTNRERFLQKLEPYISENGIRNVEDAYNFAKYGHGHMGQKRDEGMRYFEHPRAVAEIIIEELDIKSDWKIIVLALLHDVIEDTWLLNYRIVKKCFGKDIADWLSLLTRDEEHSDEEWLAYLGRIGACKEWRVLAVKLADRLHNLRTVECLSAYRQKRYLDDTEKYFFGFIAKLRAVIPQEFAGISEKLETALTYEVSELKTLLKEEKVS